MFNNGRDCCAIAYEKNDTSLVKKEMMRLRYSDYYENTNEPNIKFDSSTCRNNENVTCPSVICADSKF